MFKNLLSALPTLRKSAHNDTTEVTIDISRVIKPARQAVFEPDATSGQDSSFALNSSDTLGSLAEDAVDSLSGQFETWMQSDLTELYSAWQIAQQPDATPDDYRAVFTVAHNIKGAANAYGYPAIARLGGSLSRLLLDTRPGENSALINLHVEACRAAFKSIGQGSDGQSIAEAVCEALEDRVEKKVAQA